jgi:hypothetical protein
MAPQKIKKNPARFTLALPLLTLTACANVNTQPTPEPVPTASRIKSADPVGSVSGYRSPRATYTVKKVVDETVELKTDGPITIKIEKTK